MSGITRVLVDGDIVAFRCAASAEHDSAGIARWRVDEMMHNIIAGTKADLLMTFISGDGNFRYDLYPEYKANRVGKPRPQFLEDCREHMIREWGATVADGIEADDELGIASQLGGPGVTNIIASIDKDLRQIAGYHWHIVNEELVFVDDDQASFNFWRHVMVGDPGDNIPGLKGIGKVKAERALAGLTTDVERFHKVREMFDDDDQFTLMCQLVWVLRNPGDVWSLKKYEPDLELVSESLPSTLSENDPSMEPLPAKTIGSPIPGEKTEAGPTTDLTPLT